MSLQSALFTILCRGRDHRGKPALTAPVRVTIFVRVLENGSTMTIDPGDCPHSTGAHGHRCKASHPETDSTIIDGILCPYAVDLC